MVVNFHTICIDNKILCDDDDDTVIIAANNKINQVNWCINSFFMISLKYDPPDKPSLRFRSSLRFQYHKLLFWGSLQRSSQTFASKVSLNTFETVYTSVKSVKGFDLTILHAIFGRWSNVLHRLIQLFCSVQSRTYTIFLICSYLSVLICLTVSFFYTHTKVHLLCKIFGAIYLKCGNNFERCISSTNWKYVKKLFLRDIQCFALPEQRNDIEDVCNYTF